MGAAASNAGRKPKPAALKLIGGRGPGVDSGGRKVKASPGFVRLPPTCPAILDGEARAEWDRIVPELQRLGLTKTIDAAGLTAYCLAWQRLVGAQAIVAAEGLLREGKQGLVKHPAVGVVEAASKELRAWCAEYGLSPSAENRMTAPEASDGDANPFD